jgi:hypothetical protein
MQLVVAATNQNALYTSRLRANEDIISSIIAVIDLL